MNWKINLISSYYNEDSINKIDQFIIKNIMDDSRSLEDCKIELKELEIIKSNDISRPIIKYGYNYDDK